MQNKQRVILGIDPGTQIIGYGIIIIENNKITCKALGVIKTPSIKGIENLIKLKHIYKGIQEIIKKHNPTEVAIEAPFLGKNVQSMLKLGRAQGVAIASALFFDLPVNEYAPKKIKLSITGNGNSSKESVCLMVEKLLNIKIKSKYLDATDALGAALCHYFQNKLIEKI